MTSGFLVVDKPAGITSHQVVARARRALHEKKVGHAGTLDPMATGVMLVGVGDGTRLLGHLTLADKTYVTTIRLGMSTITDDAEGEVTAAPGACGLDRERLQDAARALTGDIMQVPSSVSAIKVDGKRAYALVRGGDEVKLAPRPVTVSRFDVTDVRPTTVDGVDVVDVDATIDCSSGTYIRALARDLGAALGTGGHLTALRRTRVGPFGIDQATWDAAPFDPDATSWQPPALIDLVTLARQTMGVIEVDAEAARYVAVGRGLNVRVPHDPTGIAHDGVLLALYKPSPDGPGSVPVAVLGAAQGR